MSTAVDIFNDMETGSSGDTLTSTNVGASSHGSGCTWATAGTMNISNLNDNTLRGPITVSSTSYDGIGTRTWRVAGNVNGTYVSQSLTSAKNVVVVSGFITVGIETGLFELYDTYVVGAGNAYAVCQIYSGGSGVLQFNIETYTGSTQHSAAINIIKDRTYWVSFKVDAAGGNAYLQIYDVSDPNNWIDMGSVSNVMSTGTISLIRFGRADGHPTTSINYIYLDDICTNFTDTTWPFLPDLVGSVSSPKRAIINVRNIIGVRTLRF